jgi:hypothetical protein
MGARPEYGAMRAGQQLHPRHRRNAGQGLASEAKGPHRFDITRRVDLTRGEAFKGQRHILGRDPRPIVGDTDQLAASVLYVDADVLCPSIEGILKQFFHHTRWALNDLPGGDLLLEVR